jgi:hypothetical protein
MRSLEFFIELIPLATPWHLTKPSSRNIFWGAVKAGSQYVGLITLPPPYADCLEILEASTS